MKILMINKFHYLRGGAERYCFDMGALLSLRGHKIIPFSMVHSRNQPTEFSRYFVNEISFERSARWRHPFAALRAAAMAVYSREAQHKLQALIDETRPDIAYLHNIHHQLSLSILPVLKQRGIPTMWRLHDYSLFCPNSLFYSDGQICEACAGGRYYHILLRGCRRSSRSASLVAGVASYVERRLKLSDSVDVFLAPSRFARDKMVEHGLDAGRLVVMPNFIAADAVATGNSVAGSYVLYFGRLSKEKGLETLIRAIRQVPECWLKVVGEGPQRSELESLAERLHGGNVEFCGYQHPMALRDTVRLARIVVLPSEWYENCPYTVLEAFAAGRPVIASAIGGIPELITHERDGLLFEPGNAEMLADRIRSVWSDDDALAQLGRNARRKVEEEFGPDRHYETFVSILSSLRSNSREEER